MSFSKLTTRLVFLEAGLITADKFISLLREQGKKPATYFNILLADKGVLGSADLRQRAADRASEKTRQVSAENTWGKCLESLTNYAATANLVEAGGRLALVSDGAQRYLGTVSREARQRAERLSVFSERWVWPGSIHSTTFQRHLRFLYPEQALHGAVLCCLFRGFHCQDRKPGTLVIEFSDM